jgi:hypothetical protein
VSQIISDAAVVFANKCPKSAFSKGEKNTLTGWANTLDQFNNGVIGPGHCSD